MCTEDGLIWLCYLTRIFFYLSHHYDVLEKDCQFMDNKEPGKEISEDMTRESLIALSYWVPETGLNAEDSPKNLDSEEAVQPLDCDVDDKYRSKLISISYSQSPDGKVRPALPVQLAG
ncbi:unnamed protein product [Fraxinus pennsylvanica]|uniref:Uncharacterized protein n=1 Tax=Fraxinus pennsylvanica TaxID=56036 RepID=A0AAD2DWM7_9LAMI|nr:unnamed protein product [Fraxinus pennsylvanica]